MHRYCFMLWMMYKCIYKVLKKKFYFWKRFCLFRVNICLILSDSVTIFVIYLILLRLTYVWKGGTRFLYFNFHAFFGNAKLSALHQFRDMSRILYLVFLFFFKFVKISAKSKTKKERTFTSFQSSPSLHTNLKEF